MTDFSEEEIRRDLELTRKELAAYGHFVTGYSILASLPETEAGQYRLPLMKYERCLKDCEEFLVKLENLYKERFGEK